MPSVATFQILINTSQVLKRNLFRLFIATLFLSYSINAFSCGPVKISPLPYLSYSPVLYQPYTEGKLGVLLSNFYIKHLILAYYSLSEQKIQPETLKIYNNFLHDIAEIAPCYRDADKKDEGTNNGYLAWVNAINRYIQLTNQDEKIKNDFLYRLNIVPNNALAYNANILNKKIDQYGAQSTEVKEWLANQKQVWNNDLPLPQLLPQIDQPENTNKDVQNDRQYQYASALLYRNQFSEAAQEFFKIFESPSPYADLAGYLYVRSFYREAIETKDPKAPSPDFTKTKQAIDKILPLIKNKETPNAIDIQELATAIQAIEHRQDFLEKLSQDIRNQNETIDYLNWQDFSYLFRVYKDKEPTDDLANWIFTIKKQKSILNPSLHAWEQWKTTAKNHWLVATAVLADNTFPSSEDLLKAMAKVDVNYPGYETVVYHHIRLLTLLKRSDEAWVILQKNAKNNHASITFQNYLSNLAYEIAPTLEQLNDFIAQKAILRGDEYFNEPLHNAVCQPYLLAPEYVPIQPIAILNSIASQTIEYLPASRLYEHFYPLKGNNDEKSVYLPIAIASYTRALTEGNRDLALKAGAWVADLDERYSSSFKYLKEMPSTQFAYYAILTLLRYPSLTIHIENNRREGLNIDILDINTGLNENWWNDEINEPEKFKIFLENTKWLKDEEKEQIKHSRNALYNPNLALRAALIILQHYKKMPKDPTLPEAIHRMIQLTKRIGSAPKESYELFEIMHSTYKTTEWAKKTPYHYYKP
jgi:hypothetical protein